MPVQARARFELAVIRDVTRRWLSSPGISEEGLVYLSLGAGGLYSDLLILQGLLANGVPVSTVVLIDTIFEELLSISQLKTQSFTGSRFVVICCSLIYLLHTGGVKANGEGEKKKIP